MADRCPVDLDDLVGGLGAELTARHGATASRAQALLSLSPLTIEVDGRACTIDAGSVRPGVAPDAVTVELSADALGELVSGTSSMYGQVFQAGAEVHGDRAGEVLAWDHVLHALLDGQPLHEPGALELRARDGSPLDLARSFEPDDDDLELAHFLAEAGFAHLRGWIDAGLLPRIKDEVAVAAAASTREKPHRWWARLEDGSEVCVRVMHVLRESPTMAALVEGDAYSRLGGLFDDGHQRFPDRPQSSEALLKPVGVVEGIADFPWHRDCSFGGHDYHCAGYAVGLPLGATDADSGHLRVIAGSHRVSVPAPGLVDGYASGLPEVDLHTEPGDLTIHVGCVLHGTRPPRTRDRAVVYTTFSLPER